MPAAAIQRLYVREWVERDERTITAIAEACGVTRVTLQRWMSSAQSARGTKDPQKRRLAAVLGIRPEDFYRRPTSRISLDKMVASYDDHTVALAAEMLATWLRTTEQQRRRDTA